MRSLLFVMWLFLPALPTVAVAQSRIDKIPAEGLWLDNGWVFQAGDNPDWAKPGFDDSRWAAMNPTTELSDLPELRTAETGWFRLKFRLGPNLANQPLTLMLSQIGASELYLNGRLIHREGRVSGQPANEQARYVMQKPVTVTTFGAGEQVLAVRYSLTKSNFHFYFPIPIGAGINPAYGLRLQPATDSITGYGWYEASSAVPISFIIGFFLVLSLLHLFIYFSFRRVKANLYFGLAMLQLSVWRLTPPLLLMAGLPVSVHYGLLWAGYAMGALAGTFIVRASYEVFGRRPDWMFRILVGFWVVVVVTLPWNPYSIFISFAGTFLVMIAAARVALLSVREGNRIGLIYVAGSAVWTILNVILIWPGLVNDIMARAVIQAAMDTVIPLVISIVLGDEYVWASRTLEAKLEEVERLSAQTLRQEQEKQHILANQNKMLEQQVAERTAEVVAQKEELEQTLENLRTTQTQLVHKEKMASLGELTAGIAHEIQNPLNFVNNFSEVSAELAGELQQELAAGDVEEATFIAEDIKNNLQRICQHGQRAGTVVKNMLLHARSSSGEVALTDLNALADEYLRIAYQSLQAKDDSFTVDLQLQLDPSLEKISLMPQEMGRVLLNLYNNAFFAIGEKYRQQRTAGSPTDFQPQVAVTTRIVEDGHVELRVRDNGIGIPDDVLPKIYQPFFTTKSGVQGNTGLGLSLSFDIVTKGHGGDFRVETEPGQYSEFIIQLPVKSVG